MAASRGRMAFVFAGTTAGGSAPQLALFFVALTLASAIGGSGLYFIVRRG